MKGGGLKASNALNDCFSEYELEEIEENKSFFIIFLFQNFIVVITLKKILKPEYKWIHGSCALWIPEIRSCMNFGQINSKGLNL
jgi:hypothetical protein